MKTDTEIQQDVMAELNWDPSFNAAQIGVEVKGGIVTLAGHVGTYAEKWGAERAAQRVYGVKALAVEIEVNLLGLSKRTDGDIALAVQNMVEWSTFLPKGSVKVLVENGWITLSGEVDWDYQRQAAARGVRDLMGVTGISNQILIKPKASENGIKFDIEAALKRSAKSDAKGISVAVHGDQVTLSGTVHSWSESQTAKESAWSSPGVRNVVNNLAVIN